jgi:hypothetical protein
MTFLFIVVLLAGVAIAFVAWDHKQKHTAAANELATIKAGLELLESEARKRASDILKTAEKQKSLLEADIQESSRRLTAADAQLAEKQAQLTKAESLFAAMRRRIDGVGDEYILPVHDLLDELAENFGYKEAGIELKMARDWSRSLVKEKRAVTCEWGNDAYKKDAIRLMLETFDAQVDVALAGLKREENVGKVMQEIRDIYEALNDYGTRCMRATIEKAYLDARLAEAKWGAAAAELKHEEREEQKAMAAALREEARVQREIEKQKREAEEEEMRARKAMEKAEEEARRKEAELNAEHDRKLRELEASMKEAAKQSVAERERLQAEIEAKMANLKAEAAEANAEQKAKFEAEKAALEEKLAEAEANKRSASMAEQTKQGHVYVISNRGSFGEGMLKVGMTRRLDPQERIDELSDASVPFDFDIHAMISSSNAPELEYELHKAFAEKRVNKVNHRKEFFRISVKEVKEHLEARNVHASWTIAAHSKEYLETLAWEERMSKDPAEKRAWAERFGAKRIRFEDIEPSPPK